VGVDIRNFEVIGRDDIPALLPGCDFLDRKLMLFGELSDPFGIQRIEDLGVGCVDGVSFSDLNHGFDGFVAV
jgi:hypothetical protein